MTPEQTLVRILTTVQKEMDLVAYYHLSKLHIKRTFGEDEHKG